VFFGNLYHLNAEDEPSTPIIEEYRVQAAFGRAASSVHRDIAETPGEDPPVRQMGSRAVKTPARTKSAWNGG